MMSQCSRTLKAIFCILDFQIIVKYPFENVVKKLACLCIIEKFVGRVYCFYMCYQESKIFLKKSLLSFITEVKMLC